MQEPSKPNLDLANSDSEERNEAEVLEWMGTAYGRRGDNDLTTRSTEEANARTGFHLDRLAGALAATVGRKRGRIAALVGLLLTVSAIALVQGRTSASHSGVTARSTHTNSPQEPGTAELSEHTATRLEIERAVREAKMQFASEHEARVALEGQVGQLVSQLAARTLDRENAERASAAISAQLAVERMERVEAEDAEKSAKEAFARMASIATEAPVPRQKTQAEPKPVETPPREAPEHVVSASVNAAANSDVANSALLQGEKLFAKGDLAAARQQFEQAAKMGMPEGALALGNTYDPVSLAKAGLNLTGDPTRARQWYRRALDLAQSHQEPRQ